MTTLADLGEINKSQIGIAGKYVKATSLTARQRSQQLRYLQGRKAQRQRLSAGEGHLPAKPLEFTSNLTRKQRKGRDAFNLSSILMAKRPAGVHAFAEGLGRPPGTKEQVAAVAAEAKRQKVTKPISVNRSLGFFGGGDFAAQAGSVGSRTRGGVVSISGDKVDPFVMTHEVAHLKPKKSHAFRVQRILNSPQKLAREEARADAIAARRHGLAAAGETSGYQANARGIEQIDRQMRRMKLKRGARNKAVAQMYPGAPGNIGQSAFFTPRQGRAYADVRRRMGTWEELPTRREHALKSKERIKGFGRRFKAAWKEQGWS